MSFILKDKKKAALIISLGLVLFFSYGHFASLVEGLWKPIVIGDFVIGHHKVFLTIWSIILLLGAYCFLHTRRNLNTLTNLLNVIAVALVAISLINIGAHAFRGDPVVWDTNINENKEDSKSIVNSLHISPDIYYIILDSYPSSSTLANIYNYDNHEFYNYLAEKGFFIASESHSNYPMTSLSLMSSLNMEYIHNLTDIAEMGPKEVAEAYQMIQENRVMKFLKSRGYKFIHFSSGWGPTNSNHFADLDIRSGVLNEVLIVLIQTTMAGPYMNHFMQVDHAQRILRTFSKLADVPTIAGPKFVFSHINCPHPPYVFDVNGELIPEANLEMEGAVWRQKELYLNQLIFINKKVEMLVDELLSKSEVPPIIILQGDHGSASSFYSEGKDYWASPTKDMLRERFGIFNAYYLPQGGNSLLYNSITPVNTFRLIFNFYFGTNYELLGDQSYYSAYEHLDDLIDVTDKVSKIEKEN